MSDVVLDEIEQVSWIVYRGQDAALVITMIDPATGGSEILSTSAFKCSFRSAVNESSPVAITLSTDVGGISADHTTGDVTISLTDTQSASLQAGTLLGQLWRDDSGDKQPVCLIELKIADRGTVI